MGLTLVVKSTIVSLDTTDVALAAILNSVTTTHIYSVSVIPISNTKAKIVMIFD